MTSILLAESVAGLRMYVATRLFAWSNSSISRGPSLKGFWAMMSGLVAVSHFLGLFLDLRCHRRLGVCGGISGKLEKVTFRRWG